MTTISTGLATSFITFSRPGASGGGATVTDRDGKIKWAGHNLLTNSESFDASAWSKNAATVAANAVVAPNATTTADTLTATGAGCYLLQSYSAISGRVSVSVFAKPGTNSSVTLRVAQAGNGYETAFTLSGSGTAGTPAVVGTGGTVSSMTASISAMADSWYLCTITFSETSLGNVFIMQSASSGTIHLWGAHLYRSDLGGMQLNPAMPAGMQTYYPTTPRNLLSQTEEFGTLWSKNSSTVSAAIATAPNGLQNARLFTSAGTSYPSLSQSASVAASSLNTISLYVKAGNHNIVSLEARYSASDDAQVDAYFDLTAVTATKIDTNVTASISAIGDGWYRIRMTKQNPGTGTSCIVIISGSSVAAGTMVVDKTFYLWGAKLSDSASLDTYVPVYGAAVTSAAYYAPRLDYDGATLAAKGLLVEEQRVNLLLQSNNFSTSWISGGGATVTSIATPAPDGINSSQKLQEAAATAAFSLAQSPTMSASTAYTLSVYMKAAERSFGVLNIYTGAASCWTWYNLSTGVVSTLGSGASATITSAGNGWYRCTLTIATAASGTPNVGIWPSNANGVLSYAGTAGSGIYLYGAQLEAGSFATSYIPNGSAVAGATRAADVASVSTQAFPYSASEGTLVVETQFRGGVGVQAEFSPASPRTVIGSSTLAVAVIQRDGGVVSSSQGVVGIDKVTKSALTLKSGDGQLYVNGTSIGNSSGTTATAYTTLHLGTNPGNGEAANGYIRRVTYIPRRLSNAELAARTA